MKGKKMTARKRAERNQNRAAMAMVTAVVLCMAVAVGIKTGDLRKKQAYYQERLQAVTEQVTEESRRSDELTAQKAQAEMPENIEKTAKEKLGLVNPDEILLKPEQ